MFPAIRAALPKSGVSSTIDSSIRDEPITTFGCGVWSLYHYMSTARTTCLIEQLTHNTPLGEIIRINMEDVVIEAGLYGSLWKMNTDTLKKYVSTQSWVFATIDYNHLHNISINICHDTLCSQQVNDQSLMSLAAKYTTNTTELRAINRVRMLFNVIHLSDVTMANDISMDQQFLTKKSFLPNRNSYNWPKKHRVTAPDYVMWRRFLRWAFSQTTFQLSQSLGKWLSEDEMFYTWCWFVSPSLHFLYHKKDAHT